MGGQLTEQVRRRPYAVVLLDEIEKAHSEVFNILLQMLDEGRLTDNKGRLADFKNTIVIMTSNLGSELLRRRMEHLGEQITASDLSDLKGNILDLLKESLRPEFLNRIDEIVLFNPLDKATIRQIVSLQFARIQELAHQSHDLKLRLTDRPVTTWPTRDLTLRFGARPIKRILQRQITNRLAEEVLSGVD